MFADIRGQRVIDIGCGDGTYTIELFERGQPASICGVDLAQQAIEVARQKASGRNIQFAVESAYGLPYASNSFDVACLRGVLHHTDRPMDALREALRVAPLVVIIEPNGYNPVLKVLERVSSYHREHREKSYSPRKLDRWVYDLCGCVQKRKWVGLVPMFCPDWMARVLKAVEPYFEEFPCIRCLACGQYVLAVRPCSGNETGIL